MTTGEVAATVDIPALGDISVYELRRSLMDGMNIRGPNTALKLFGKEPGREITDSDCLLWFADQPATWFPQHRVTQKKRPGAVRLEDLFSPIF